MPSRSSSRQIPQLSQIVQKAHSAQERRALCACAFLFWQARGQRLGFPGE